MPSDFPLEAVLRLRRLEEETKLKEFAAFERVRARERATLDSLQETLMNRRAEMGQRASGEGLSSQNAQLYLAYFSAQNAKVRFQVDLIHKVEIEVRRRQRAMTLSIYRRKIFDRLKEKFLEDQARELRRREMRQLDDIAGMRFHASSKGALAYV